MALENKYIRSLVESAQTGNSVALDQLFQLNLERIYTLSHRLTGNQHDAEKLASRVFVEACKNISEIKPYVPFTKWLINLNVNVAIQQFKESEEESRGKEAHQKNIAWRDRKKKTEIKEPDPKLSPLDMEICKLPDRERILFVLSRIENYSTKDLANLLQLFPAEVEQHLKNATDTLLNSELIQTARAFFKEEALDKKLSEIHYDIKADSQIISNALNEIYAIRSREKEVEENAAVVNPTASEPVLKQYLKEKIEEEKQKRISEKNIRPEPIKKIRTAEETASLRKLTVFGISVIIITAAIYIAIKISTVTWEVQKLSGVVRIDDELIQDYEDLSQGETLKSDVISAAGISIPEVGYIKIEAATSIKRLENRYSMMLNRGIIKVNFSNAAEQFSIIVPGGSIISGKEGENNFKNNYSVEVDDYGQAKILVNTGWLFAKDSKNEVFAPPNYFLSIYKKTGCGLPYYKNANPELIDAIENYSFTSRSELFVEKIISLSSKNEIITLWNLLKRVSLEKRISVYQKLNELSPHSDLITRDEILNLDDKKLQKWLAEIKTKI